MKVKIQVQQSALVEKEIFDYYKGYKLYYKILDENGKVLVISEDSIYESTYSDSNYFTEITADEFNAKLQETLDKFTAYLPSDKFDDTLADLSVMNHRKAIELNTSGCAEDIE